MLGTSNKMTLRIRDIIMKTKSKSPYIVFIAIRGLDEPTDEEVIERADELYSKGWYNGPDQWYKK